MAYYQLTAEDAKCFQRHGYLIIPGFLDAEETRFVYNDVHSEGPGRSAMADSQMRANGPASGLRSANRAVEMVANCHRMINAMEHLLGGDVYLYDSAVIRYAPHTTDAPEWRQNYGYWYRDGCLYPDMISCSIALNRATRENGCLRILKGSHHMGRISHDLAGKQPGADMERVQAAMRRMELMYCEMEPGTALLLHANLLYSLTPNNGESAHCALMCSYGKARGHPYMGAATSQPVPLQREPDTALKEAANRRGCKQMRQHAVSF